MDSSVVMSGLQNYVRKLQSQFKIPKSNLHRPYIVPTAFGIIFGITGLFMFAMALASNNNVIYLIAFVSASLGILIMVRTNSNLKKIEIQKIFPMETFANEAARFRIRIANEGAKDSFLVRVQYKKNEIVIGKISPSMTEERVLETQKFTRGLHPIPRINLETRFPFEMFRSWKVFQQESDFVVYPEAKGDLPFPQHEANQNLKEIGLFRGLREFQSSDSVRRIDWRASQKHDELLVKAFEGNADGFEIFRWSDVADIQNFEEKLSQICKWICVAEQTNRSYGLDIGTKVFEPGHGPKHFKECLSFLASLSESEVTL